ncbi:MAG: AgmX/PglI C-terminal domain-containing protein [bacterium]
MALTIAAFVLAMGCGVPQEKYDTTVNKLNRAEKHLKDANARNDQANQRVLTAESRITGLRSHMALVQQKLAAAEHKATEMAVRAAKCKEPPVAARPADPVAKPAPAGAAEATGGLDAEAVRAGIDTVLPKIKNCYDKLVLKKGKKIGGTLLAVFQIKRGKPRGIQVRKGTLNHRKLQKCVRNVLRRARFKKEKKVTKVKYPFTFAP